MKISGHHPLRQLSFVSKLAARSPSSTWGSLKNVTSHQRGFSSEHMREMRLSPTTNKLSCHTQDPKGIASRRSSYLGIRSFFTNTLGHSQKYCSNDNTPFSRCSYLSTFSRYNTGRYPGKTLVGEDCENSVRHRQRIPPPQVSVRIGEPFFEEIMAYSARCVTSMFLPGT